MAEQTLIPADKAQTIFVFDNNREARLVCGTCDENLVLIERHLQLEIHMRGNQLLLLGESPRREQGRNALSRLYDLVKKGISPDKADTEGVLAIIKAPAAPENAAAKAAEMFTAADKVVDGFADRAAARQTAAQSGQAAAPQPPRQNGSAASSGAAFAHITTRKKQVYARTPAQNAYIAAMRQAQLVFGIGPAGTGKTYLAVAYAAALLENGLVEKIILSRPAVEAGERLGFLPGDMKEKVDPYLRPLYDALYDMMPAEKVERALNSGIIEIAPLAFMRGRTLARAAILLDEAQNTTAMQMKMLLTRLGEGSHMVINGDPSQIDLPAGQQSGLLDAAARLQNMEHIAHIRFSDADVVRHPLVAAIIRAYARQPPRAANTGGAETE